MNKKIVIVGQKLKNLSDSSLAHSHKQGATVNFMLTAVDPKWGRYMYCQYKRSGQILNESLKYYKKVMKLLGRCRQLNVEEKTGFRFIPDIVRDELEIASIQFIVLTKLGLEYLAAEYQLGVQQIKIHRGEGCIASLETEDLVTKLKILKDAVGIQKEVPAEIYTILSRRDIVEHPTTSRLWNGSETEWKNVNLSWVLSGDMEDIVEPVVSFINEFINKLENYIKDNPIPGNLNISHRGLKAGEPYKKPINE